MHAHQDHKQRDARRSADRPAKPAVRAAGTDAAAMLALQRSVGNAAVNRLHRAADAHGAALSVQRALQDHLTDAHWRGRAAGKKRVPAPAKASKGRAGDKILGEVGPGLLKKLRDLSAGKTEEQLQRMGRLEIFRAMPIEEAEEIELWWGGAGAQPAAKLTAMENWITDRQDQASVSGEFSKTFGETKRTARPGMEPRDGVLPVIDHLGDEEQARTYHHKSNALMKFILKPGAHELLFHPDHMAVFGDSNGRTPQSLRAIHGGMPEGKKGEGKLEGYVGLKQEKPRVYDKDEQGNQVLKEGRGDFSLSLGENKWSRLLFQLFVQDIQRVG